MPNLDVKVLRYMSNEEFRVLTAVEMGMKNHEIVPSSLIESISGLKRGGAFKLIRLLAKNKLVGHQSKPYDGYRLTSKGYDYLALKTLCKRGAISAVGIQIGVGKESDIFTAVRPDGEEVALKLHKLGRSFRTLKNNRDYTRPGQSFNWLYMSRLSALKEFAFMSALHSKGFSVPTPIDVNRHVVVMSLAHGYQLNSIQMLRHPSSVFNSLMVRAVCPLASSWLVPTHQPPVLPHHRFMRRKPARRMRADLAPHAFCRRNSSAPWRRTALSTATSMSSTCWWMTVRMCALGHRAL